MTLPSGTCWSGLLRDPIFIIHFTHDNTKLRPFRKEVRQGTWGGRARLSGYSTDAAAPCPSPAPPPWPSFNGRLTPGGALVLVTSSLARSGSVASTAPLARPAFSAVGDGDGSSLRVRPSGASLPDARVGAEGTSHSSVPLSRAPAVALLRRSTDPRGALVLVSRPSRVRWRPPRLYSALLPLRSATATAAASALAPRDASLPDTRVGTEGTTLGMCRGDAARDCRRNGPPWMVLRARSYASPARQDCELSTT